MATWTGNNYTTTSGLSPNTLPSPGLKWETTKQFDIGLDIGLFRDRFTFEIDYYQKNTEDLLLSRPLPAISGFTSIFENVGRDGKQRGRIRFQFQKPGSCFQVVN